MERVEELRLTIGELLGRRIRWRAAQLGVYPADYARTLLTRAVDKDLREDITAIGAISIEKKTSSALVIGKELND